MCWWLVGRSKNYSLAVRHWACCARLAKLYIYIYNYHAYQAPHNRRAAAGGAGSGVG